MLLLVLDVPHLSRRELDRREQQPSLLRVRHPAQRLRDRIHLVVMEALGKRQHLRRTMFPVRSGRPLVPTTVYLPRLAPSRHDAFAMGAERQTRADRLKSRRPSVSYFTFTLTAPEHP
jgi:hypothetical protein